MEILEYRLVPLMISVVNIGEDLSASALTRCLGYKKSRTNISRCGFGWVDYALFVLGIGFILLYFRTWRCDLMSNKVIDINNVCFHYQEQKCFINSC